MEWEHKMSYDCCIEKDKNWFRYRTGGILIHDGKMLFVKSESFRTVRMGVKKKRCFRKDEIAGHYS